jgi:hypothetical protein
MRLLYLALALFPLVVAKDLGIRFSKVLIDPRYNTSDIDLPLTSKHFPISTQTFLWLRNQIASTVIIRDTCQECYWGRADLVQVAGGYPSHPSTDRTSPYWAELAHVVETQHLRRQNVDPKTVMPLPDAWMNFTIKNVVEAVHDEFLGIYHIGLLTEWDKAKSIKIDQRIIPFSSNIDFIRSNVMLADLVTWAIARVGPSNFLLKWHIGLARPEEIAYKIATGAITEGATHVVGGGHQIPQSDVCRRIHSLPRRKPEAPIMACHAFSKLRCFLVDECRDGFDASTVLSGPKDGLRHLLCSYCRRCALRFG